MRATLSIVFCFFAVVLFSQSISSRFIPRQRGWSTFGIDGGWAYQSSDVRTTLEGWGAGITVGKNLAYRPGGALSFDIRGRLLFTRSYGYDWRPTFDIENNEALNGTYQPSLNYVVDQLAPLDSSFVFANHRTGMGELGVEGVFTFNRLRERTGIVFSLFGGVGLDLYRTRIDQADASGNKYNYLALNDGNGKANTLAALQALRDGNYETRADGSTATGIRAGIMPGAGMELGYQLTRKFVIGIGHKTTFSRTDILDGQRWYDNGIATNDWAHYTHVFMRWDIARRDPNRLRPPVIDITDPNTSTYISDSRNCFIRADISHVAYNADIRCFLNGESRPFDFKKGRFGSSVRLEPGRNEFRIEASNPVGRDVETVIIVWEDRTIPPPPPPAIAKPIVKITNPSYSPFKTNEQDIYFRARVDNVSGKRDVRLLVNGAEEGRFTIAEGLEASLRLRPGRNIVRVEATNPAGTAYDEVVIEVGPSTPPPPPPSDRKPLVTLLQPAGPTATTQDKTYALRASVTNVDSRDAITLLLNGQSVRDFEYSPRSGELSANIDLAPNDNRVIIRGRNSAGEAEASAIITRQNIIVTPPRKPEVTIVNPTNGALFERPEATFSANVRNITTRNEVVVVLNGTVFNGFDYNERSQTVSGSFTLRTGENTLTIKVSNNAGASESTVRFRLNPPTPKPIVQIINPLNGAEFREANAELRASLTHVANKNEIGIVHNGRNVLIFDFNPTTGQVSAKLTLAEGDNNIVVKATNNGGSSEASVRVRMVTPKKPTVTITAPADRSRVSDPKNNLTAQTTHVFSDKNVVVKLNGIAMRGFTFDRSGVVSMPLTLKEGQNTVTVEVATADGAATATVSVVYAPNIEKPTITFLQPGPKNIPVTRSGYQFKAKITGVAAQTDLVVKFNGKANLRGITFNSQTGELTYPATLVNGTNNITIEATNAAGTAIASAAVNYAELGVNTGKVPEVKIRSASNPTIDPQNPTVAKTSIVAELKNVPEKTQITILVNEKPVTNFNYNTTTGILTATGFLQRGTNKIVITAKTPAGEDSDSTEVKW